jgi:hypothetical protein
VTKAVMVPLPQKSLPGLHHERHILTMCPPLAIQASCMMTGTLVVAEGEGGAGDEVEAGTTTLPLLVYRALAFQSRMLTSLAFDPAQCVSNVVCAPLMYMLHCDMSYPGAKVTNNVICKHADMLSALFSHAIKASQSCLQAAGAVGEGGSSLDA